MIKDENDQVLMTLAELRRAIRESLEEEKNASSEEDEPSSQPIASDEEGFLIPESLLTPSTGFLLGEDLNKWSSYDYKSPKKKYAPHPPSKADLAKSLADRQKRLERKVKSIEKLLPKLKTELDALFKAAGRSKNAPNITTIALLDALKSTDQHRLNDFFYNSSVNYKLPAKFKSLSLDSSILNWSDLFSSSDYVYNIIERPVRRSIKLITKFLHDDLPPTDLSDLTSTHYGLYTFTALIKRATQRVPKIKAKFKNVGKGKKGIEPAGSVFGMVAFAPNRISAAPAPIPEPNNKIEQGVLQSLNWHIDANNPMSAEKCNILKSILRAKKYTDVITPPANDVIIYRGMQVSEKFLVQILKSIGKTRPSALKGIKNGKIVANKGTIKKKFVFVPRRGRSSSWSDKLTIAKKFAGGYSTIDYNVILKARASDNKNKLMMGPNGAYKLKNLARYKKESEVIALDKIKVFEIEFERLAPEKYDSP